MANERGDGHEGTSAREGPFSPEALEQALRALEPLLRQRARVGAPRRAFVVALRTRLLAEGPRAPALGVMRRRRTRGRRMPRGRRRAEVGIMLAAAVLTVLALGALTLGGLALAPVLLLVMALVVLTVGRQRL